MSTEIPDDPSQVKDIFEELRVNFHLGVVQKVDFREKALSKLIEGYIQLQPEIDEALKHDCGYNPFMSNFVAHNITLTEVRDLQVNVRKWMKPRPTQTPLGIYGLRQL